LLEVIAARPAAMVINTHSPPRVQVNRYHQNLVFITVNLLSLPSLFTLEKRKYPNLTAQTIMRTPIKIDLISNSLRAKKVKRTIDR
jgi:hypothetical protein